MWKNLLSAAPRTIDEIRRRYSKFELFRVWPEWSSPGLWTPAHIGATPVGDLFDLDELQLSDEIKARLDSWHAKHDTMLHRSITEIEMSDFRAEGLSIAIQVSREFGPLRIVEYELADQNFLFIAGNCVAVFLRPPPPANP